MGAAEVIGLAGSLSLLAGWRLYLTVLAAGLAVRFGLFSLPEGMVGLEVLGSPWVLGLAAVGTLAELFADKIAILDSLWDTVHTLIRPLGGALIASAVVSPSDPVWQVAVALLGGGASLIAHGAKAGTRALVNTSPEPFSNVAVSSAEDVGTAGLLYLALGHPEIAGALALLILALCLALIYVSFRLLRTIGRRLSGGPTRAR